MLDSRGFGAWRGAIGALLVLCCTVTSAAETGISEKPLLADPFPTNEKLSYAVSWMGIHCGVMEIVSFTEARADGPPIARVVVLMRTTKFFDGIYRVRSRLDSFFDPAIMSSFRYEERSREKKKSKEETWVVDFADRVVLRTKNGSTTDIPIDADRALDPLAFVFKLRTLGLDVGEQRTLSLMTSKGVAETVVTAVERDGVRTKMGRCDAVGLVPQPQDRMMFSKSGEMVVWIDRDSPHRPCRIEFDLSFGKLVASLRSHSAAGAQDVVDDWEQWGSDE
jgi:hypothetical protein